MIEKQDKTYSRSQLNFLLFILFSCHIHNLAKSTACNRRIYFLKEVVKSLIAQTRIHFWSTSDLRNSVGLLPTETLPQRETGTT